MLWGYEGGKLLAKATKRSGSSDRRAPRKGKARAPDVDDAPWNEAQARRELHRQLAGTMSEFLDHAGVPERGRIAIVARITHRARQGVARWFVEDEASGALPDALSIYLFAQAFQADANHLFGFTQGRRPSLNLPGSVTGDGSAGGPQQADADPLMVLAKEIGERFPGRAAMTMVGDEMEPTLKRGTKVWLDDDCTGIQGNGMYALDVDGRPIVRIVEDRLAEGVILSCENKRYREQLIPRADLEQQRIKVIGKVVGWFQAP